MGAKRNNLKAKFLSYFNKNQHGYDCHIEAANKMLHSQSYGTIDFRRSTKHKQKTNIENMKNQSCPFNVSITRSCDFKTMNLEVHDILQIKYAECLTESSRLVPVPLNITKPVMYTTIDNRMTFETVNDVREYKKCGNVTWLVVTQRFLYNSKIYEAGDVLEITNRSIIKKFMNTISKTNYKTELNVISHPKQERAALPSHIKGNFRMCDSPYSSCYRLLSDLIHSVELPFLITLPIDSSSGEIMHQGKVSFSKHNKRLLVMREAIMNLVLVSQDDDERVGVLNLSNKDHIEMLETNNNLSIVKHNKQSLELFKPKIFKHLKKIYESKDIVYFDEKSPKPVVKPMKRKSFKNGSFMKRRRSNTDTVQLRNNINKNVTERKQVTSLIISETSSNSHSFLGNFKRFSYHPPRDVYKVPSYSELLEKDDDTFAMDISIQQSVRDRNGYLVPVTGFTPEGEKIHGFTNPIQEYQKDYGNSDDEAEDVEVGDDGYVLVTPTKQHSDNMLNQQKKYKYSLKHLTSTPVNEQDQSNMLFNEIDELITQQTHNGCNYPLDKGNNSFNYKPNEGYKTKHVTNDVNKNNIIVTDEKPIISPKPASIKQHHSIFQKSSKVVYNIMDDEISNKENLHSEKLKHRKTKEKPLLQSKRFSAIIDRFEQLSGSTDKLSHN